MYMGLILAVTFTIVIMGFIPYVIAFIISIAKKRWKLFWCFLAFPIIAFFILDAVLTKLSSKYYTEFLSGICDTKEVTWGNRLYEYRSSFDFQGDGFFIAVYELPAKIRNRFESADKRLLTQFPKCPESRNKWSIEHWQEAPLDKNFEEYINFAIYGESSPEISPELFVYLKAIRKSLARKRTYYAFAYYNPGNTIHNIKLYIVDLEGGRLYAIYKSV
jgi:hypothetical protein